MGVAEYNPLTAGELNYRERISLFIIFTNFLNTGSASLINPLILSHLISRYSWATMFLSFAHFDNFLDNRSSK